MSETKPETKNIYEKMQAVKIKAMGIKKSGTAKVLTKAGGTYSYAYFELCDMLNVIVPALAEERLCMNTTFFADKPMARMVITDIDKPEDTLVFETYVAEYNSGNMSEIQAYGARQTYTRRYLLQMAFDIAETDIIDGNPQEPEKEGKKKPAQGNPPPQGNKPHSDEEVEELKRKIWAIIKVFPDKPQNYFKDKCRNAKTGADFRLVLDEADLHLVKREVNFDIQRLPVSLQEKYIARCKGANKETLMKISGEVKAELEKAVDARMNAEEQANEEISIW
jgi:hypothetical protein